MVELVQHQLVELLDQSLMTQYQSETKATGGAFQIADQQIEIEIASDEMAVAYLNDAGGHHLVSYTFRPGEESASAVLEALGLEAISPQESEELDDYLRSIAA
jgi:hypothetical protein